MISQLSNISFKSTPIYNVKVKKFNGSSYEEADAVFSRFNFGDAKDREALEKIKENWKDAKYCPRIVHNFLRGANRSFYAIELKGEGDLSDRVVTLASVEKPYCCNMNFLHHLQSKVCHGMPNDIKGGGEVMMYGIVWETKKRNFDKLELCASQDAIPFYKLIGLSQPDKDDPTELIISRDDYDSFLSKIEKKYNFPHSEEIK